MKIKTLIGTFFALVAMAVPAIASEPAEPSPATHEEMGAALDDLAGQFHTLGARFREHFMQRESRAGRPLISLMLGHRDELGLSPAQVQSLEQLRSDFQKEAIRRQADLRIAQTDLSSLLRAEAVDLGRVEVKLREIERMRADLQLARIRTIEQGKSQLTPEQRAKFQGLLESPPPRPRAGGGPQRPQGNRF